MKSWMIWVVFAWFLISSLQLWGIYSTLREIRADVSQVRYDLEDVRDKLCTQPYEFTIPKKPLPSR